MEKKTLLILMAMICMAGEAFSQRCYTDQMADKIRREHPEVIQIEQAIEAQIKEGLKHIDLQRYAAKGTHASSLPIDNSTFIYDIPVVVHVIHDYGNNDYLTDDAIFEAAKEWNIVYAGANADTADVIPLFKPYIGNPGIRLHLATKDPYGNPTKGITHHQSYLSSVGGDQAKYDQWPNNAYLNIWFVASFAGQPTGLTGLLAYALPPASAQIPSVAPYDGVICKAVARVFDKTINHEVGHIFNLIHCWGSNPDPAIACGDDEVDDTPPTTGHWACGNLYDTACAIGYVKHYFLDSLNTIDTLVDYPDTANVQNIMDYSSCALMFTKGQVYRMHQALNLPVANRNHLWDPVNLAATGALLPVQDLKPIPDFSVEKGKVTGVPLSERTFFYCANESAVQFGFTNRSWNDTITQVKWHFSNGAAIPDTTVSGAGLSNALYNSFSQPGWVTVTMDVTGNGAGGTTTSSRRAVYAADGDNPIVVDPQVAQYVMDFNPGQTDTWPIFNYYNNEFKWQLNNTTGYLDNTCIEYTGFDSRHFPANMTGTPAGDYDDFFTPAFNLTAMSTGDCNLNFMSAGTFRTGSPADMKDSLFISYSIDCGKSWQLLQGIGKHDLANNGTLVQGYGPLWWGEWALHSITIPATARTNKTFFRFRYRPGADANLVSTGNNFYLDRINIGNFPLGVNTLVNTDHNIAIAPNPASGSSYVIINGINSGAASVQVTDVTGRVVYNATQKLANNLERIEIPASVLQVKGMYMVHVKTDTQNYTGKLVAH